MSLARVAGAACLSLLAGVGLPSPPEGAEVLPNDNRAPAGRLRDGVLALGLVAARGTWYPEAEEGPGHEVFAFGEETRGRPAAGAELLNPGPLVRVPAGTEVRATVRNALGAGPLVVHGLHDRPGLPDTLHVPAGGTREARFRLAAPGTYFYWATTRGALILRDRVGMDTQLHGAIIVDPPGATAVDEVFVIGLEGDTTSPVSRRKFRAVVVNGRSWPHVPVQTARMGDTVRMRWINASDRRHPMHLHGFHFRVDSRGDAVRDTVYAPEFRRLAATEPMASGGTFAMTWVPTRPGNWLLHCHMAAHVSPALRLGPKRSEGGGRADRHAHNHTLDVMAGLVTGWRVLPADDGAAGDARGGPVFPREAVGDGGPAAVAAPAPEPGPGAPRRLRLLVHAVPGRYGDHPGLGFVLHEGGEAPAPDSIAIPGAPLVLRRGRPVAITVVNRAPEPTSVHWHGIELDSYFDGVSGFSGHPGRITPPVEPGDSLEVRFTPPRAGTFIYHSHFEEERQLSTGLYGPLLVLEPGAPYDPGTDLAWVLAQGGPLESGLRITLNGSASPALELKAGRTYRVRLININPSIPLVVSLLADSLPVAWRHVAKDGADLPPRQRATRPAVQLITVGETYDFELTPAAPGPLRLEARDPLGMLVLEGVVAVRPGEERRSRRGTRRTRPPRRALRRSLPEPRPRIRFRPMAMIPDPPVTKMSPRSKLERWIRELERLGEDEALQDPETQRELQGHLNDARTWLDWDLHRRVVREGEELMAALREVGALGRRPGAPPRSS